MLLGQQIADLSAQAARRAAQENRQPLIVEAEDLPRLAEHIRHIPDLGGYRPPKWSLVETYFVDSSGFGEPGDPALTFTEFCSRVKVG
mgnify:CR=1 FL=1